MSRKGDLRKGAREAIRQAKADQAVRVDGLERSLGCRSAMRAAQAELEKALAAAAEGRPGGSPSPAAAPVGAVVVPLRPRRNKLEGI
jgi:hypothetical protein